jgi:hypothetical protein
MILSKKKDIDKNPLIIIIIKEIEISNEFEKEENENAYLNFYRDF